jgi:hypothetical protein
MKRLPFPGDRARDLWDAGRILPVGGNLEFSISNVTVHEPVRLVLRVAPVHSVNVAVWVSGQKVGDLPLEPSDGWQETEFVLPATVVDPITNVRLELEEHELILYHLWGVQAR